MPLFYIIQAYFPGQYMLLVLFHCLTLLSSVASLIISLVVEDRIPGNAVGDAAHLIPEDSTGTMTEGKKGALYSIMCIHLIISLITSAFHSVWNLNV